MPQNRFKAELPYFYLPMKTIWTYLTDYLKDHFNFKLYFFTTALIGSLLWFNFSFDFEDSFVDTIQNSWLRIGAFVLLQGIPYYLVCLFVYFFTEQKSFFKNKHFWIISLLGFLIIGFDRGSAFHVDLIEKISTTYSFVFLSKVLGNFFALITIVLPLWVLYHFYLKKDKKSFYGLYGKEVNLSPYWVMLLIMVPLIYLASLQEDFTDTYPIYFNSSGSLLIEKEGFSQGLIVGIFELSYAFSFFVVELLYRGFLIFALVKYLGKEVVLPMAVTYCVIHFGKPLGEAISSYFGGYLLGLIALKTENIYGGIMVHVGIALLMELFAFMQY